jgi:hypothetical protein
VTKRHDRDPDETAYMGWLVPPPPEMPGAHRKPLSPWFWVALFGFLIFVCLGICGLWISDFVEQVNRVA